YRALVLWSPSASNGDAAIARSFGGAARFAELAAQANAQGFVPYETDWGQKQQLSGRWFADLAASRPADALAAFAGDLLVLYGDADEVIDPALMHAAALGAPAARSVQEIILPAARHGLGLFSEDPASVARAVSETARFLTEHLAAAVPAEVSAGP
ncbi:MAG: hypothetical protein AAGI15_08890, partial [Pseudomonadota bacterium]